MAGTDAAFISNLAARWVADPASDIVWTGEYEGRIGMRMAQRCRDFTTVWFDVGERTVGYEAYVLTAPSSEGALRACLRRNWNAWPAFLAADPRGDLFARGRIPLAWLDEASLDLALGAVYELVESSFPALSRETGTREKSI